MKVGNEPSMLLCKINNVNINFQVDIGSHISTLSVRDLLLLGDVKIYPTKVHALGYSGNSIEFLGETDLTLVFKNITVRHKFFIVDAKKVSLLGRDLCSKLGIGLAIPNDTSMFVNSLENDVLKDFQHYLSDDFVSNVSQTVKLEMENSVKEIFCKARPISVPLRELVKKELRRLEENGIITKVYESSWASPTVNVMKDKNNVRICGDFSCTVNRFLKVVRYPLPSIDDIIAQVGNARVFSKIDLANAFLQLPLDTQSKEYTTINTSEGLYRFNYLPFGLCSSPGIFQSFMCKVLNGIDNIVIYQDDILILTETVEEHRAVLKKVLSALRAAGIKVNRAKCLFFTKSVSYLGHIFDAEGVHPNPDKVRAVIDAPQPENLKQVQSFVGLCNFYNRFIPNFASVFAPLYKLLKKNVRFTWGEEQQKCFRNIKEMFCSKIVLQFYNPYLETLLETDASSYGIAAVLMQRKNKYCEWFPVQFASRTLNESERNYSNIEREALSVVFGCERFRKFLLGSKFTIRNDQQPLRKLFASDARVPTTCSARIQRWKLRLSQYKYDFVYSKGVNNVHSDCLSRLPLPETVNESEPYELIFTVDSLNNMPVTCTDIQQYTDNDRDLSEVKHYIKYGFPARIDNSNISMFKGLNDKLSIVKGCILYNNRVFIPEILRARVLESFHESHPGICAMKSLARSLIWYPGIDNDITNVVKGCSQCQAVAAKPPQNRSVEWPRPSRVWSRIHVDHFFFEDKVCFIVVDALSKYIECEIVKNTSVCETIDALRLIFSRHGLCDTLVSDNASCFTASEFREFLNKNGIQHITPPPYSPSSNGQAERGVRVLKDLLKKNVLGSFKTRLSMSLLHYRTVPHSTTQIAPCISLNNRKYITVKDRINPNYSSSLGRQSKSIPQFEIGD